MKAWRLTTSIGLCLLGIAQAVCPDAAPAAEPEGPTTSELLILKSGDELMGTSLGFESGQLRWKLPSGGVVSIPLDHIKRLEMPEPEPTAEKSAESDTSKPKDETSDETSVDGKSDGGKTDGNDADKTDSQDRPEKSDSNVEPALATESGEPIDSEVATAAGVEPVMGEPLPLTDAWYEAARSTYYFSSEQTGAWTKRFEFGGSWVEGNSNTTDAYVGGMFERQFERAFYQLDWNGRHSTADDEVTQSRWQFSGTTDLSHNEKSKWILFGTHKHLFDHLSDVNYRGTFASGIGYRFINEETKRLIFRVGPGTTFEKHDPPVDERITFDAFSEVDAKWPVFDRTYLEYKSTFTPSIEDVSVFRFVSKYGLLVALDESESWAMKLGMQHLYNSDPNPDLENSDFTTTFSVVYSRD